MRHLDLFSGIGGFAYAVDQVWDDVEHTFCETDKFCQAVLTKHWPGSEIIDDIRTITADTYYGRSAEQEQQTAGHKQPNRGANTNTSSEGLEGVESASKQGHSRRFTGSYKERRPFLLTGGFPCQPFSAAGVRRGTADERYLWPEMLRVVRLTKPEWVIAENVRGLLTWENGLVFEQICSDLEAAGYEVQPFIIPAVAVNAPHRRDRIWWVAHAKSKGQLRQRQPENDGETSGAKQGHRPSYQNSDANYPHRVGHRSKNQVSARRNGTISTNSTPPDPRRTGGGEGISQGSFGQEAQRSGTAEENQRPERFSWSDNWLEVAAELCGVDDELSAGLDFAGYTKAQHRVQRLKALGNAIVPAVAVEIMKGIKSELHNL